jgi:hypothetical protein
MQIRSSNSFKNALQQAQQQTLPPPQLIFAVMASPEVLKKAGRNCPETPEQMNLVELMCEFVEAMNPGLVLSKKPQILKDRDLTGELKDIWSAVQNFRDKEKAGVSDIVVYTEFGPESAAACSPPLIRPPTDTHHTLPDNNNDNDEVDAPFKNDEKINSNGHEELDSPEKSITVDNNNSNGNHDDDSHEVMAEEKSAVVVIEKLSLSDNASSKKSKNNSNNLNNENESSEKLVKAQNQKNKESHHFLPKFLTSNKDKDTKEKDKGNSEEQQLSETKVKTKKSLNFFRRNKTSSSATGSPTHTTAKSDAD